MNKVIALTIQWFFVCCSIWSVGLGVYAQQQTLKILIGSDGVRGRVDGSNFVTSQNVETKLGIGDTAEIIGVKKFLSGNFGLQVRVLKVANQRSGFATEGKVTWVHYKPDDPILKLLTQDNKEFTGTPDQRSNLLARMLRDGVAGTVAPLDQSVSNVPVIQAFPLRTRPLRAEEVHPPNSAANDAITTVDHAARTLGTGSCTDSNGRCGVAMRPTDSAIKVTPLDRPGIAGEKLVEWDECAPGQPIRARKKGVYNSAAQNAVRTQIRKECREQNLSAQECSKRIEETHYYCSKKRVISEAFVHFIKDNMPQCVAQAAQRSGIPTPIKDIQLAHTYGYDPSSQTCFTDRNTGKPRCRWSFHAVARAMDIKAFELTTADNKQESLYYTDAAKQPNGRAGIFYKEFRDCWEAANKQRGCGSLEKYQHRCSMGAEDPHNHDHKKILHLSMPYCPRDKVGFGSI